jgi:hypothetical protein
VAPLVNRVVISTVATCVAALLVQLVQLLQRVPLAAESVAAAHDARTAGGVA